MTGPSAGTLTVAVVAAGRGRLPYARLHRRPLVAHALAAAARLGTPPVLLADDRLGEDDLDELPTGTVVTTAEEWWPRQTGAVLLHDPLCPLTPASVLEQMREAHRADPTRSVAGFRPVTDTVKTVRDDRVVGTVDRDRLAVVTSPVLLAQRLVALGRPPLDDFAALVAWARGHGPVDLVKVPSLGRRVQDEAAVHVLECVDEMAHQLRHPG
jgi:hypothetical protein